MRHRVIYPFALTKRLLSKRYTQGEYGTDSNNKQVRQYYYFIDHQGQLFLDDARMKNFTSCIKDKDMLKFFFHRLQWNNTNQHSSEFPFVSPCGAELNFVRSNDCPFVYTKLLNDKLEINHSGVMVPFQPDGLFVCQDSGRLYHVASDRRFGIALIKSSLAEELFPKVEFSLGGSPKSFWWNNELHVLRISLQSKLKALHDRCNIDATTLTKF